MIAPMAPAEALTVEELGGRILGVTPLNLNLAPCSKLLYEETPVISPTARAVPEPPHPHSILSSKSYFRVRVSFAWCFCIQLEPSGATFSVSEWCGVPWKQEAHKTFQEVESTDLNQIFLSQPRFEASSAKHKATWFVAFHTFLISTFQSFLMVCDFTTSSLKMAGSPLPALILVPPRFALTRS